MAHLLGIQEDMRRAFGTGISLHGGPTEKSGRGSFTSDLCVEEGPVDGQLSP
jgi:hypothetical protein